MIATFLINQMLKCGVIDSEDRELYEFGLHIWLIKLLHYFVFYIFAFFSHSILETTCFLVMFITLRRRAGGYHASTKLKCLMLSVVIAFSIPYVVQISLYFPTLFVLNMLCASSVIWVAPVGTEVKPIEQEMHLKFKKELIFLLICNLLVSFMIPQRILLVFVYAWLIQFVLCIMEKRRG